MFHWYVVSVNWEDCSACGSQVGVLAAASNTMRR
jgi:hypothetical protein